MGDRRRNQRTTIDLLVNKYVAEEPHLCRAVNISRRGMLIHKVFEPDVPMGEVTVEFQLPGDEHVIRASGILLGEHQWARAQGVRFTRITPEDAVLIDAFVGRFDRESAFG